MDRREEVDLNGLIDRMNSEDQKQFTEVIGQLQIALDERGMGGGSGGKNRIISIDANLSKEDLTMAVENLRNVLLESTSIKQDCWDGILDEDDSGKLVCHRSMGKLEAAKERWKGWHNHIVDVENRSNATNASNKTTFAEYNSHDYQQGRAAHEYVKDLRQFFSVNATENDLPPLDLDEMNHIYQKKRPKNALNHTAILRSSRTSVFYDVSAKITRMDTLLGTAWEQADSSEILGDKSHDDDWYHRMTSRRTDLDELPINMSYVVSFYVIIALMFSYFSKRWFKRKYGSWRRFFRSVGVARGDSGNSHRSVAAMEEADISPEILMEEVDNPDAPRRREGQRPLLGGTQLLPGE